MGKTMAETVPDAFDKTVSDTRASGLDHPILQRMTDMVNARSKLCVGILDAATD